MPRRLLERCRPDSIREFRAAALRRFHDGLVLTVNGNRTGAIYLWGYAAEMILKSAYFSLIGVTETAPITWDGHLLPAIVRGREMHLAWPRQGQGHNVAAWAELLVAVRAQSPATAYTSPLDLEVQRAGQRIWQLWRETLRYHKNVAYPHEVKQVREACEWLLANSPEL